MAERHLAAYGIVHKKIDAIDILFLPEAFPSADKGTKFVAYFLVSGRAFGSLGEDLDGTIQIDHTLFDKTPEHSQILHDKGIPTYLANKAKHLGMTDFTEDYDLTAFSFHSGIGFTYPVLKLQHHRTGAVDHLETEAGDLLVC